MGAADFQSAVDCFSDIRWRLNNLYFITDKAGSRVKFEMNWAQERLFRELHYLNVILKARQIGFSTFIQILMLDACVFNSNIRAGTIAHNREDAEAIFRDKAKYPYDNLPEGIRAANPALQDSARELRFQNNSSLRVGTSLRSGTFQYLHISEHGKICAKYPEKAKEVRTGALNTVQAGQFVFVESTAEGQTGDFFDICQAAETAQRRGTELSSLDFKFHFFPWWQEPGYTLQTSKLEISDEMRKYFADLEAEHNIKLSPEQKAWYCKKQQTQQDDMLKEFPSTPEEAFKAAIEGAIFAKWVFQAERGGRVTRVPHNPAYKVNTWWDLGQSVGNEMSIWFWQQIGPELHFIDYLENTLEDLDWYILELQKRQQERRYVYGRHSWPHDGGHKRLGLRGRSLDEIAYDLGLEVEVQPRYDIAPTITKARQLIPISWFDAENCTTGLKALRSYRYEFNEEHGIWSTHPLHDWASNGASAFRTGAMSLILDANAARTKPRDRYAGKTKSGSSAWAA